MARHKTAEQLAAEVEIIKGAQKNPARFRPLYDAYYHDIYLFIFKRVDHEDVAGDLTSQVFYKALHNIEKFKFQGVPFSAWLFRIASNEANQFFRKTKVKRSVYLDETTAKYFVQPEAEADNYEAQLALLGEALNELKPGELELVEMRYFEERAFKEIAYILGLTENNAKVRTHRVLQKLKKIIHERKGADE